MEFVDAPKISDIEGIKRLGLNFKEIDQKLVTLFAEQIFHTGFVHADPHHGNIFVRKLNGTRNSSQIVLIDHGLYDFINETDRRNLCKLWKYIILKDEEKMKFYSAALNVPADYYLMFGAFLTMRPLHRPIHARFVYAQDWAKMSTEEREASTEKGLFRLPTPREFRRMKKEEIEQFRAKFRPFFEEIKDALPKMIRALPKGLLMVTRFSDMLTMEPPMSRSRGGGGLQFKSTITEDDMQQMRAEIRNTFDRVQVVLKQVSPYMLLVFRNLNTVRSIVHDHGNRIDRHTIMARSAIYGAYKSEMRLGLRGQLRAWFELKTFDLILAYDRFSRWLLSKYMQFMVRTGRISEQVIKEIYETANSSTHFDYN